MGISRNALVAIIILLIIGASCRNEKKLDVAAGINPAKMATMTTHDIATVISDSGIVKYKIVAPLWSVYDEVDTPYWTFPKGLYLQQFDDKYKVVATVAADSAKFFKNQKLWRLDGHVEMSKVPKDLFLSERLFWDQRRGKIYSDTFIHIETATHVLEGLGFESDDKLTSYRILRPQAIFPIKDDSFVPTGAGVTAEMQSSPTSSQGIAPASTMK